MNQDLTDNRRKHRRFALAKTATIVLGPDAETAQGKLIDLSENGASITSPWAVTVGVGAYIRFLLDPDVECEATGTAVRVFPFGDHYGVAVELGYGNPAFLNFLRNLDAAAEAIRPEFIADIRNLEIRFA